MRNLLIVLVLLLASVQLTHSRSIPKYPNIDIVSETKGKYQGMSGKYLHYLVIGYRGISTFAQYLGEKPGLIVVRVEDLGHFDAENLEGRLFIVFTESRNFNP